jgi:hypothetical protein
MKRESRVISQAFDPEIGDNDEMGKRGPKPMYRPARGFRLADEHYEFLEELARDQDMINARGEPDLSAAIRWCVDQAKGGGAR